MFTTDIERAESAASPMNQESNSNATFTKISNNAGRFSKRNTGTRATAVKYSARVGQFCV